MVDPGSVRFRGPLKAHVRGFWTGLLAQGYSPLSGLNLLRVAAHLSRWLQDHRLGLVHLSEGRITRFLVHRRRLGYTQHLSRCGLRPLLDYLSGLGLVVRPTVVAATAIDRLLGEYAEHLARERCLSAATIRRRADVGREFVRAHSGTSRFKWDRLTPSDIADYVLRQSRRWSVGYCKDKVTALRSFLAFLHVHGDLARNLADCVPAVAGWRLAWLPRALEPAQVKHLLGSADRRSTVGLRDAAIVCLMVRLGLRAGEVSALMLDDLDWRCGEIVVHGKGVRESRMPLPQDVGEALSAYLHRRPSNAIGRKVFLRSRAPYRGLGPGGVIGATRHALRRAGIVGVGAHVLRHTAATQMLHRGASLSEIAHVLRHRHIDTTAIYAKVDLAALRKVARPWPQGAA
jgi:site-specific recombinase XerD